MKTPITIDSCRVEYQEMLAANRDGWIDLPCGGSILIEGGKPTRISDKGDQSMSIQEAFEQIEAVLGRPIALTGRFRFEPRSPEMTAPIE